jgi:hypothetical protein
MPAYFTQTNPAALYMQDTFTFWNAEAVPTGAATNQRSIQCALSHSPTWEPIGMGIEISFSGNPGNFQIDFQTADTDASTFYFTIPGNSINQGAIVGTNYACRLEIRPIMAKFCTILVVGLANAVNVTVKGTYA